MFFVGSRSNLSQKSKVEKIMANSNGANETLSMAIASVKFAREELTCTYYTTYKVSPGSLEPRRNELRRDIKHWQGEARKALEALIAHEEL